MYQLMSTIHYSQYEISKYWVLSIITSIMCLLLSIVHYIEIISLSIVTGIIYQLLTIVHYIQYQISKYWVLSCITSIMY